MHQPTERDLAVLQPALHAARRALRRLEDQDVPPDLKKVASSSARTLPRPHALALFEALDAGAWLRSKALDEWEGDAPAARAFLERLPGWELEISRASVEIELRGVESERDRAVSRLAAAEERLRRFQEQVRKGAEESRTVQQAAEVARREERDKVQRRLDSARSEQQRLEREVTELRSLVSKVTAELEASQERNAQLEVRLRNRREGSSPPDRGNVARGRGAPLEVARMLDDTASALALAVQREPEPKGEASLVFEMPLGVAPDQPAAIAALLAWPGRGDLLIDGYNLAKTYDGNGALPDSRRRVEEVARRLRTSATGMLRVIVVWDSAEGDDDRYANGIEIRFRPSADEEIVAEARSLGARAIVVTGDRELRERAEAVGATGLWSSALAGWKG